MDCDLLSWSSLSAHKLLRINRNAWFLVYGIYLRVSEESEETTFEEKGKEKEQRTGEKVRKGEGKIKCVFKYIR